MKNSVIYLFILLIFITSCQGAKDALQGKTRSDGSDEFLVEKKNPLSMPPDFNKLPEPNSSNDNLTSEETDNLKDKLNINQKIENITTSNTNKSLDKSIIEKINN